MAYRTRQPESRIVLRLRFRRLALAGLLVVGAAATALGIVGLSSGRDRLPPVRSSSGRRARPTSAPSWVRYGPRRDTVTTGSRLRSGPRGDTAAASLRLRSDAHPGRETAAKRSLLRRLSLQQLAGQRIVYAYTGLTPPRSLIARIRAGEAAESSSLNPTSQALHSSAPSSVNCRRPTRQALYMSRC